jgi:DNA primase
MISPKTIEAVKELSIVDVISNYVDLKKAGNISLRGKSPFTNEKTGSFYVVPARNFFKDFSSGKGGGAIKFVMEKEGLTYIEAIERIARDHQIPVEYERNGNPQEYYDEIETLYKINLAAARRYAEALIEVDGNHPAFIELINKRRFTPDTIAQWEIGYAPGDITEGYTPKKWNFLSRIIIEKGLYKPAEELGLIKTKNEINYDAFRHRIIFPIIDQNDRTVGFGARALRPDQYNAKYINSPDSKIYNKAKVLFGLNFAGQAIRKQGYANLMEGFTDVISFHQSGVTNTVGTCGTALTDEQCILLKRYTNKVVMINDPDEAGQNAALRNIDLLMKHGFQTSIIPLPSVVQLKRNDPTPQNINPQPWREHVVIFEHNKEFILVRHERKEKQFSKKEIDLIEKIDPDEFTRLFMYESMRD